MLIIALYTIISIVACYRRIGGSARHTGSLI